MKISLIVLLFQVVVFAQNITHTHQLNFSNLDHKDWFGINTQVEKEEEARQLSAALFSLLEGYLHSKELRSIVVRFEYNHSERPVDFFLKEGKRRMCFYTSPKNIEVDVRMACIVVASKSFSLKPLLSEERKFSFLLNKEEDVNFIRGNIVLPLMNFKTNYWSGFRELHKVKSDEKDFFDRLPSNNSEVIKWCSSEEGKLVITQFCNNGVIAK